MIKFISVLLFKTIFRKYKNIFPHYLDLATYENSCPPPCEKWTCSMWWTERARNSSVVLNPNSD